MWRDMRFWEKWPVAHFFFINENSVRKKKCKKKNVIFDHCQATHKLNIWVGGATSISPPPSNALCNHFAQLRVLLERSWIEKNKRALALLSLQPAPPWTQIIGVTQTVKCPSTKIQHFWKAVQPIKFEDRNLLLYKIDNRPTFCSVQTTKTNPFNPFFLPGIAVNKTK